MKSSVLFSSRASEWGTPEWLFDWANENWGGFLLDACATQGNQKVTSFYSKEQNAPEQPWAQFGKIWMNPPYGRHIRRWLTKARDEGRLGATVVALVAARTNTRWFQDIVFRDASEIVFVRGRIPFVGSSTAAAPFPSAVVVFEPERGTQAIWAVAVKELQDGDRKPAKQRGEPSSLHTGRIAEEAATPGSRAWRRTP